VLCDAILASAREGRQVRLAEMVASEPQASSA
jgi:hypothetical protein